MADPQRPLKKVNPLGFLTSISPVTYLYIFIIATVVYFVVKYWKVLRWLGLAAALVAALPILADGIAAVIGGIGGALLFMVQAFTGLTGLGTPEDVAADIAKSAGDQINQTAANSPNPEAVNEEAGEQSTLLEKKFQESFETARSSWSPDDSDFHSFEDDIDDGLGDIEAVG